MTVSRKVLIVLAVFAAAAFGLPWGGAVREASAQISVTAADPPTGEQGALNLSVIIKGKGFKNGAKAMFFKTKTADPAGVNVKSTQFVSSTQLIASIDIADGAALSLFDIQVANTDGRTGKGTELFSVTAKKVPDTPLLVTFGDIKTGATTCSLGAGWCGDGVVYESDARVQNLIAQIRNYDFSSSGYAPVGGFEFYLSSVSGRSMAFDFRLPVVDPDASWCPEVCPDAPSMALPNFTTDPIKVVSLFDNPQYSPPNYDFLNPSVCETGRMADGRCANDFSLSLQTARKEYRLRFSPNIWRSLAYSNTLPYGVMGVAYDANSDSWALTPLLSHPSVVDGQGTARTEPCPVVLERKDTVKGMNTWVFLGCYDMPFEITLTRK